MGVYICIYKSACKDRLRSEGAGSIPDYRDTGYMDTNAYGSTYAHRYMYRICTYRVLHGG